MSIHLETIPLPLDQIDKASDIKDLKSDSSNVDFKITTKMTDFDLMEDILENNLLGFKNKRSLTNFRDSGMMCFNTLDNGQIQIALLGGYDINDSVIFLNNLTKEYFYRLNQMNLYEEIVLEDKKTIYSNNVIKPKKEVAIKKQMISTNMKNKEIIENIMKTSYLGYNTEEQRDNFINKGEIMLSKTKDGTYDIIFLGNYNKEETRKFLDNLKDEYATQVQEITYENVLKKIKEQNYSLESEIVDDKDSIVLTINI
ncbi:MAG: hypothetical protein E7Z84_01685 [Methanosphaera stadtmanae]|nr:hypothetical protein [Methanosphaera stadtmanae]